LAHWRSIAEGVLCHEKTCSAFQAVTLPRRQGRPQAVQLSVVDSTLHVKDISNDARGAACNGTVQCCNAAADELIFNTGRLALA